MVRCLTSHGTDDVGGLSDNYPSAARKLADLWKSGKAGTDTLKPYQNAENLSAAALGKLSSYHLSCLWLCEGTN